MLDASNEESEESEESKESKKFKESEESKGSKEFEESEESEDDTDDTLIDLHVLVLQPISPEDTDVIMEEDELLSLNQPLDLFGSNVQLTSATAAPDFHLEEESSLYDVIEQKKNNFFASQSSTFSQDRLPSTEVPVVTAAPLPHGPVLIDGVYYQPVLAPHNAQSTVPASTVVPCVPKPAAPEPVITKEQPAAPDKPKMGLEFVMPETPPPKKSIINLQLTNRLRSISRQRKKRNLPRLHPRKPSLRSDQPEDVVGKRS